MSFGRENVLSGVQHLNMDHNTDLYEIESGIMLLQNLFYGGERTCDVVALKLHDIGDMDLFEISCASALEKDARYPYSKQRRRQRQDAVEIAERR